MSEGVLNGPINPDYVSPTQETTYEVEYFDEVKEVWTKARVDFGLLYTDDFAQAMRVRDTIRDSTGRKTRVFEVHTTRKQMSI